MKTPMSVAAIAAAVGSISATGCGAADVTVPFKAPGFRKHPHDGWRNPFAARARAKAKARAMASRRARRAAL